MTTAQLIGADPGWLIAVKALLVFVVCSCRNDVFLER